MKKVGRPQIIKEKKQLLVQKLEPYLKSGLSLRKACFQAGVSRSTIYYLMDKDREFLDKIKLFRQYVSVMLSNAMTRQLYSIIKKQNDGKVLEKEDTQFLCWFALNSNATREEFGRRQEYEYYDPEQEVQRIANLIDSVCSKGIESSSSEQEEIQNGKISEEETFSDLIIL